MAIYNSNSLNKAILAEELTSLKPEELVLLTDELEGIIATITTQVDEVQTCYSRHGYEPDESWLFRAKKKLRISQQFLVKVEDLTNSEHSSVMYTSYQKRYQLKFVEILTEELGPDALKRIQDEASTWANASQEAL
tara:strand:+ start:189 stop:596 length:408 start_codon:yes stop_codon:yes gene_type:complete